MPTFNVRDIFWREYNRLTPEQQLAFLKARDALVVSLRLGAPFPQRLRISELSGHAGIFELTWDLKHDGRATFELERRGADAHVTWRRIGGHEIFKQP